MFDYVCYTTCQFSEQWDLEERKERGKFNPLQHSTA